MKRILALTLLIGAMFAPFAAPAVVKPHPNVICGNCGDNGLEHCNYPHDWFKTVGGHTYVCLSDGYWH